jgi:hypothetical protein
MRKETSEERIQEFINDIKKEGLDFKRIEMFVKPVNKTVTFIISIYNQDQINEYLWDSETEDEDEEIEFWVQEMGGAAKLAKSIGMVDTHNTFK